MICLSPVVGVSVMFPCPRCTVDVNDNVTEVFFTTALALGGSILLRVVCCFIVDMGVFGGLSLVEVPNAVVQTLALMICSML